MDKTKAAVHIFDTHAQTYQTKYMDISMYHKSLDLFCDLISSQKAEILELACGPGNITKYLIQKQHEYHILATDLSPKMLELAKINNPTAAFELMDCRNFSKIPRQFDGLIGGFGLPYLSKEDAVQLIADAAQKLTPSGVIYLSTMEGDYAKSGWVGPGSDSANMLFMHYHEAEYLTEALKKNGFLRIETERVTYSDSNGKPVVDLILIGKKGAD